MSKVSWKDKTAGWARTGKAWDRSGLVVARVSVIESHRGCACVADLGRIDRTPQPCRRTSVCVACRSGGTPPCPPYCDSCLTTVISHQHDQCLKIGVISSGAGFCASMFHSCPAPTLVPVTPPHTPLAQQTQTCELSKCACPPKKTLTCPAHVSS